MTTVLPPLPLPALPLAPAPPACDKLAAAALALGTWLSQAVDKQVHVTWTTNRSTMLSYRSNATSVRLRLHRMFALAQARELEAMVAYISGRVPKAARCLDAFIAAQMPHIQRKPVRRLGPAKGAIHDLQAIFVGLNRAYFHDACTARIMWGQASARRRAKRSIQLGCYVPEDNLIRMHPCLDQSAVPLYFVTGVVFHEMLHEVFGVGQGRGRRSIHPAEFVAVEQSHPDYARCAAWERQHLARLLRWRP